MRKPDFEFEDEAITGRLVYQLFRTTHALGRRVKAVMGAHGVSRMQGAVLGHLCHHQAMTATDLRRHIGVTAASMSKMLGQMEQDGLIARTPNPDDARSMLIHLTGQGEECMKIFPKVLEGIDALAFEGFSEGEREQLKAMLIRIRANLGEVDAVDEFDVKMMIKEKRNVG